MQGIYEKSSSQGLVVMTIDIAEERSVVEDFMKNNGYSFPVLLDTNREASGKYNASRIPITFFIGKDGIIKEIKLGAFTSIEEIEGILARHSLLQS